MANSEMFARNANTLVAATSAVPTRFTLQIESRELLTITAAGEVIAPSIESAGEAGKVFVNSIRRELELILQARPQAA